MGTRLSADGLLFDLDGVLADSTAAVERHWVTFAMEHGLQAAAVLQRMHGRRAVELISEILPAGRVADAHAAFVSLETSDSADTTAMPGAARLLGSLRQVDTWAVVTSGARAVAVARLRAARLPVPDVLVTADDVRSGKPHPEGYLAAADELQVSIEQCLIFEDSPTGLRAGLDAGATVIGLSTTHPAAETRGLCHHQISDLRDVEIRFSPPGRRIAVAVEDQAF